MIFPLAHPGEWLIPRHAFHPGGWTIAVRKPQLQQLKQDIGVAGWKWRSTLPAFGNGARSTIQMAKPIGFHNKRSTRPCSRSSGMSSPVKAPVAQAGGFRTRIFHRARVPRRPIVVSGMRHKCSKLFNQGHWCLPRFGIWMRGVPRRQDDRAAWGNRPRPRKAAIGL